VLYGYTASSIISKISQVDIKNHYDDLEKFIKIFENVVIMELTDHFFDHDTLKTVFTVKPKYLKLIADRSDTDDKSLHLICDLNSLVFSLHT